MHLIFFLKKAPNLCLYASSSFLLAYIFNEFMVHVDYRDGVWPSELGSTACYQKDTASNPSISRMTPLLGPWTRPPIDPGVAWPYIVKIYVTSDRTSAKNM